MWNIGEIQHLIPIENGARHKVSIFLRSLRSGDYYYARFKVDQPDLANGQRYITKSLKTKDLDEAIQKAHEEYAKLKFRQDSRLSLKEIDVNNAIDKFLNYYEEKFSSGINGYTIHMLRGYKKSVDIYWKEYIGEKPLNNVNVSDFEEYETWRRNWAKNTSWKVKKHGNYKENISTRTIEWEVNAFKTVLRWCSSKGLYKGQAFLWRYKKGEKVRRSSLTINQYKKLYKYLNTDKFLYKGNPRRDFLKERHRVQLKTYIHFMINTGLRVGEARYLKWGDISQRKNKLDHNVLVVRVSSSNSKVNRERNVVGRNIALNAIEEWKEYREDVGDICSGEKYIFCNPNGIPIQDFREGFNNVIREAGIEFDADGKKYTIYSLRHTYMTFRLQYSKGLSIYSLAKNCGTSVAMIEQYYSDAVSEDFIDELTL